MTSQMMPVGERGSWRSWLTPSFVHKWAHVMFSGSGGETPKYRWADLASSPLSDFHEAKMVRNLS